MWEANRHLLVQVKKELRPLREVEDRTRQPMAQRQAAGEAGDPTDAVRHAVILDTDRAGAAASGARTGHAAPRLRRPACPGPTRRARRPAGSLLGEKGEPRRARLRTLVARAQAAGGQQAADRRITQAWRLELAHCRDPDPADAPSRRDGQTVRREVERLLETMPRRFPAQQVPLWLQEPVAYVGLVLRRLGAGLSHCYDVPSLPRTNNAMEQFSHQLKAGERRATGHRRSDTFVVRYGGFAAYAAAASSRAETEQCQQLATVSPAACQRARQQLCAIQERQTKMRRFHLRPDRSLSNLEHNWNQLTSAP